MGRKAELTIPKGFKDKNGKVCTDDLCLEIDETQVFPQQTPKFEQIPQPQFNFQQPQQTIQTPPPQPTPEPHNHNHNDTKKITHEDIKEIIPRGINVMECPGGNCGNELLKNPKQTKKYKTCPNGNCEANTVPKGAKACPYCTKPINEDDELDDGVILEDDEDEEE